MPLSPPTLRVVPMQEQHASAVCEWSYESPYDIYGWLPWPQMQQLGMEFGDPVLRREQYRAIVTQEDDLVGFVQFFPMVGVTRIGVSMRPDLCGRGLGKLFMETIVNEANQCFPTDEIDLEVHTWNTRAIRAYESVGFTITDTYDKRTPEGLRPFHCMVLQR